MIGAAAARATDTDGAAIVVMVDLQPIVLARFGWCALTFGRDDALTQRSLEAALFIAKAQATDDAATTLRDASVAHYVSAHFSTNGTQGFLCVFGTEIRWLSGAQEYVLRTLARDVADQLELASLRSKARNSNERLRLLESVVVNANDAVLITEAEPLDEPGPRIVYANSAFTRTTGFELTEIVGKTPRILHGPDTDPASRAKLRGALMTWSPVEVELLNYKKDGTPFWVELSIVPVADESGWWTHWVSVQRDVTERKTVEEAAVRIRVAEAESAALATRAFNDELTGMRNRSYFMDRLRSALQGHDGRCTERLAVLFFDLDRFKVINDSLGHRVGDLMLVEIGRRLQACVRAPDLLARMGGDEFTIMIEDEANLRSAIALSERIIKTLREPIRIGGNELFVGASIGICFADGKNSSPDMVLRNADIAMYRAKEAGGMRYAVFDVSMHERASSLMRIETELRSAMASNSFVLYYQALVGLTDGRIYGFESLIRWLHPMRGVVGPSDFIAVAEETGLIVALGSWVLREACQKLLAWEAAGIKGMIMSVNVSGRQLFDKTFRNELQAACTALGPLVTQLQIEITESVLLERTSVASELLQWVRTFGVRIAFDDFGTGFSSLSYLLRFKIDTLKIDGSFIASMSDSAANVEVVRTIVSLGRALGMEVVAEGIEDETQRAQLMACESTSGQGYLFSKPIPAEAIPALIARLNPQIQT